MSDPRAVELNRCMQWFVDTNFSAKRRNNEISVSARSAGALSDFFQVRVRANDQATLKAIDTAVEFYAHEIDPDIIIDFT